MRSASSYRLRDAQEVVGSSALQWETQPAITNPTPQDHPRQTGSSSTGHTSPWAWRAACGDKSFIPLCVENTDIKDGESRNGTW